MRESKAAGYVHCVAGSVVTGSNPLNFFAVGGDGWKSQAAAAKVAIRREQVLQFGRKTWVFDVRLAAPRSIQLSLPPESSSIWH
jgi:hypothetical protein